MTSEDKPELLGGRVALVTGGGSGIGAATAVALAAAGASVAVTDLDAESAQRVSKQIAADGGRAVAHRLDVTDEAAWQSVAASVVAELGPITILHGNAGPTSGAIMSRDLDVLRMDVGTWDLIMAVVLRGNMLACKHVLPSMITAGGGAVVFTSSIKGRTGSTQRTAYGTAKGGLDQLTRAVAAGYGPFGVRCNAIAPGIVATPGLRETAGDEYVAKLEAAHLMPRLGKDADIASMVVYLASDAGSFITAQTIVIDGGLSSYVPAFSPRLPRADLPLPGPVEPAAAPVIAEGDAS